MWWWSAMNCVCPFRQRVWSQVLTFKESIPHLSLAFSWHTSPALAAFIPARHRLAAWEPRQHCRWAVLAQNSTKSWGRKIAWTATVALQQQQGLSSDWIAKTDETVAPCPKKITSFAVRKQKHLRTVFCFKTKVQCQTWFIFFFTFNL